MDARTYMEKNQAGISGGLAAGGAIVETSTKDTNVGGKFAAGALGGASAGFAVGGPWGAAAGALIGGAAGAISASKAKQAEQAALRISQRVRAQAMHADAKAVGSAFSTENVTQGSYSYKKGGYINYSKGGYLTEGGEVMYSQTPVKTDANSQALEIAPNTFKLQGDSHNQPSGGIHTHGGKEPFTDNTGNQYPSGFVLSRKLKTDPRPYLNFKKVL